MAEPDWRALYAQLMDAIGTPGGRYEGAPYSSKDPQQPRMLEGQVDPDVGFLDPVDMLAGALAPGARTAVKALGRTIRPAGTAPASFSPEADDLMGQVDRILDTVRSRIEARNARYPRMPGRSIMRSQRGSTGGPPAWGGSYDDPDDLPFGGGAWDDYVESLGRSGPEPSASPWQRPAKAGPALPLEEQLESEVTIARERIKAVMDEYVERLGSDMPEMHTSMYGQLERNPGEGLYGYAQRLSKLEEEYNADELFGAGYFPESRLEITSEAYRQTPTGTREAQQWEAWSAREAASRKQWNEAERRVNPYGPGQGPEKRTIEMDAPAPPKAPSGGSANYADVIKRLFNQGGR